MKKISKTFQLPQMLVELAKLQFHTDNTSHAIRSSVETAIMHNIWNFPDISVQRFHLLTIAERKKIKSYTCRMEDWLLQGLHKTLNSMPDSNSIILALLFAVVRPWENQETASPTTTVPKLINVLGSKWDTRLQSAIAQIVNSAGIN